MDIWIQNLGVFLGIVGSVTILVRPIITLSHNVVKLTSSIDHLIERDALQDIVMEKHGVSIDINKKDINLNRKDIDRIDLEVSYIKKRIE